MQARNHDDLCPNDLKVELISERPQIDPANVSGRRISNNLVNSGIACEMPLDAFKRLHQIGDSGWRSEDEPFHRGGDVMDGRLRIDDRKGHNLTL